MYKEMPKRLTSDFLLEIMKDRIQWNNILKYWEWRVVINRESCIQQHYLSEMKTWKNHTLGITAWGTLMTCSPGKLVKIILKQPFGNSLKDKSRNIY